jgi:hypothetical protein
VSEPVSCCGPTAVDSGLLVMSRFPIVKQRFRSFKLGIFSDSASDKGYIYCKINVRGDVIHLFTLHLQASYLTSDQSLYHKELSLITRRHQCQLLKREMTEILSTEFAERDLILMIGDFNINAHEERECLEQNSLLKAFIPEEFHEYNELVQLMEGTRDGEHLLRCQYRLRDLLFEHYGFHPTTYGEEGLMVLTHRDEYGIPQRLDYAFQVECRHSKPALVPVIASCEVEKGKVEGQPFTQLSDHYGMTLRL